MQLEALLCVELRSAEGVDCETLFGWDSTCETAVVPASTLDVVFIAFGVLNRLVWLSLWVVVVEFNVVDADCENEMRVFCACETAFVPASTLDVVFIVVWLLLEI